MSDLGLVVGLWMNVCRRALDSTGGSTQEAFFTLEWGTVGEWVGGLATAGALAVAGYQVRELRQSEERVDRRRREAAARSLTAFVQPFSSASNPAIEVRITNGSQLPVYEVQCILSHAQRPVARIRVGTVVGGSERSVRTLSDDGSMRTPEYLRGLKIELRFMDAYGMVWRSVEGVLSVVNT